MIITYVTQLKTDFSSFLIKSRLGTYFFFYFVFICMYNIIIINND